MIFKEYECHKKVMAFKICDIGSAIDGYRLYNETGKECVEVKFDWYVKHEPQIGGYFVMYKDGYTSYSPAEAFESGYVLTEGGK